MADLISWVATAATIIAACMTASNLGARVTGYGFAVFTIGSVSWTATGLLTDQPALTWTNVVLTFLNGFGVWRWLGRQARVEEGGRAAAEASETTPGEPLFPVSLLLRAPVRCGRDELGNCIDAMAECRSGKLAYIVVSQGGSLASARRSGACPGVTRTSKGTPSCRGLKETNSQGSRSSRKASGQHTEPMSTKRGRAR